MDNSSAVADTITLFSLIDGNIRSIFINGILGLTEQQKSDLEQVSSKFKELGLTKISAMIDDFCISNDKTAVQLLMRLFTANRLLRRIYTKDYLVEQMKEVLE